MTIQTGETYFYGPQGTHYGFTSTGKRCGAENLGANAKVPAQITIARANAAPCTTAGFFWRTQRVFNAEVAFAAGSCEGVQVARFVGQQQPPCALDDGTLLPCIIGDYGQE
jgi:hypothetical protein